MGAIVAVEIEGTCMAIPTARAHGPSVKISLELLWRRKGELKVGYSSLIGSA